MDLTKRSLPITITSLFLLVLAVSGPVQPIRADTVTLDVKSNLWFEGTSTVRDWACKEVTVKGNLKLPEKPTSTESLLKLLKTSPDKSVQTTLIFPVKRMACEQGETMDGHMRDALEAGKYPEITYRVQSVQVDELADSPAKAVAATVTGNLTIKETTREVSVPVRASVTDTGTIRVTGKKNLDITEYGVEPPTVMWTITVYENITLHPDFIIGAAAEEDKIEK